MAGTVEVTNGLPAASLPQSQPCSNSSNEQTHHIPAQTGCICPANVEVLLIKTELKFASLRLDFFISTEAKNSVDTKPTVSSMSFHPLLHNQSMTNSFHFTGVALLPW